MSEQTTTKTERPHRKVRRGYVLSDKMDKTVVVEVEERYTHSLYGKVLRRSKKVKVHDEHNEARPGDLVQIMETRPLSATKHCRTSPAGKTPNSSLSCPVDPPSSTMLTKAVMLCV